MKQASNNLWCQNPIDLFRLASVAQNDTHPASANAAYIFGNTPDHEVEILEATCALYAEGTVRELYLCGTRDGSPCVGPSSGLIAYSGPMKWREVLIRKGIPSHAIREIQQPELAHTGTEAELFVALAKERAWKTTIIVAAAFHVLRAYVNTVSWALRTYSELNVYARPALTANWNERALCSQGIRCESILINGFDEEYDRLNRHYGNKWDLVSAIDVLEYIKKRDRCAD